MKKPSMGIVIPCYNEEEVLPEVSSRLEKYINTIILENKVSEKSKIFFIDDGSTDNTWNLINKCHLEKNNRFSAIKLSRNSGHQNALICGLLSCRNYFDMIISMDADLQDDITVINEMINMYKSGYEIVYGVRSDRNSDSFFKRITAHGFYNFLKLMGVDIVFNHADFRLMGKQSLDALSQYGEVNIFLRGIVPKLGFKTGIAYYSRGKRFAGKSKYSFFKMLALSLEGITSLTIKPIRAITLLGFFIFIVCVIFIFIILFQYFNGVYFPGSTGIILSLWGLGGLLLLSIGIVGEYIGKIYLETKHRPLYHIEQLLNKE